jgi:uncharacterized protein YdhG (YjbR/CyaY superfamily)
LAGDSLSRHDPGKGGKGTLRFPFDKPIPYDLIRRIVKFRVKEVLERT